MRRSQLSFRSLAFPAALAVSLAVACSSGSNGSVGDPCMSAADCSNQLECVQATPDGTCSSTVLTCLQTCSTDANCVSLGGNYHCCGPSCGTPDVSGLCRANCP